VDSVAVRLLVPGVALAVLLLAVFFAQREATAALSRNVRAQGRAEQEVSLAYRSETLLLDLETGVRGFLLTHGVISGHRRVAGGTTSRHHGLNVSEHGMLIDGLALPIGAWITFLLAGRGPQPCRSWSRRSSHRHGRRFCGRPLARRAGSDPRSDQWPDRAWPASSGHRLHHRLVLSA
jgi:hypothetical protein